jgi:hypothetical protein
MARISATVMKPQDPWRGGMNGGQADEGDDPQQGDKEAEEKRRSGDEPDKDTLAGLKGVPDFLLQGASVLVLRCWA